MITGGLSRFPQLECLGCNLKRVVGRIILEFYKASRKAMKLEIVQVSGKGFTVLGP